jgi:hypothetical protein
MNQQTVLIVAIIVIAAAVLLGVWYWSQQRKRERLREHFGPEYERVASEAGDPKRADRILTQRQERVNKLDIRPLPASTRDDFVRRWREVQARFVDDPRGAINDADKLIGEAMVARGYPVGDFEQRAADVSVEHPTVVTDYRAAHDIALNDRRQRVSTEELRRAMVHYRSLFEDLVSPRDRAEERLDEREETRR